MGRLIRLSVLANRGVNWSGDVRRLLDLALSPRQLRGVQITV